MSKEMKIWFPYEVFYIESLLTITRTIQAEQNVVVKILDEIQVGNYQNDKQLIDSIQNICTQTALVSKFFWPIDTKQLHKDRGERLREVYKVDELSCLRDKNTRNFIEHFDEKLDLFLSKFPSGTIIPKYVGPKNNSEETKIFRAYFTDKHTFSILGLEYQLYPILRDINVLHLMLEEDMRFGKFSKR